jgi:hypothetical protein
METTSIDKLTRLSVEFQSALQLANKAIEREEAKKELCDMDQVVWTWRTQLVSITSKFPDLRNPDDDKWLVDKEKVKKIKPTNPSLCVFYCYLYAFVVLLIKSEQATSYYPQNLCQSRQTRRSSRSWATASSSQREIQGHPIQDRTRTPKEARSRCFGMGRCHECNPTS